MWNVGFESTNEVLILSYLPIDQLTVVIVLETRL